MKGTKLLTAFVSALLIPTAAHPIGGGPLAGGADVDKNPLPRATQPIHSYDGVVTAVDGESITVQGFGSIEVNGWTQRTGHIKGDPPGVSVYSGKALTVRFANRDMPCVQFVYTRELLTLTSANGGVTMIRRTDQQPRRFAADTDLVAGKWAVDASGPFSYRLSDVRVGDEVDIKCRPVGTSVGCHAISIRRRAGGLVPPTPDDTPDTLLKYHERMNAHINWEESRIPFPDQYHPGGNEPGIAPPPRIAIPRIPPAAP